MSNWFEDYIQYYYIHFYHWVLTTVRRVENIRSQMWWRKISLSSRLSLLFRQSKNTELSFFVSQIFTSALFYSSSLSFLYNFLAYLLVLLSLLRLNGDDLLIQVYFLLLFFCSFVTTLHIFFYSVQVCIFYVKMMINIVDLVRKTLLGHIIITHALFFCVNVCVLHF